MLHADKSLKIVFKGTTKNTGIFCFSPKNNDFCTLPNAIWLRCCNEDEQGSTQEGRMMRSILERPLTHFEWSFTLEFRVIWEPHIFCLYVSWTGQLCCPHSTWLKTGQSSIERAIINLRTSNPFQTHIICTHLNSICVSWYYQVPQKCFISFNFCFIFFCR